MDGKRAMLFGAGVYIFSLALAAVAGVLMSLAGLPRSPLLFAAVAVAITIGTLVLLTLRYFARAAPGARPGLQFGIVTGVVGIAIDTAIRAALVGAGLAAGVFENLESPAFYGGVLMIIVVATAVGFLKKKNITLKAPRRHGA